MENKKKINFVLFVLALASMLLFTFVSSSNAQDYGDNMSMSENDKMSDSEITNAIEFEMRVQAGVPVNEIDVTTLNGIVTLDGDVDNLLAKQRANKISQMVKGVRGTVNNIDVMQGSKSDAQIKEDIEQALLTDPATESYEIFTSVLDGVATLGGEVESWQEKNLAEKVAKSVQGVTEIDNNIQFDIASERIDSEIKLEIREALHWDILVNDGLVDVSVEDGVVNLSGLVGSATEQSRAIVDSWVEGVKEVNYNNLEVEPWIKNKEMRETKYVYKSDSEIKDAVVDAFLYDPRVMSFNPDVEIDNGKVILKGKVDNLKAKRAAEATASNVVGVWKVDNMLKVRNEENIVDSQVEDNVERAIGWNTYLTDYEVNASVNDGKVYLTGNVDTYFEKYKAEEVATKINGVTNVVNKLTVDTYSTPYVYDYEDYTYYPYGGYMTYDFSVGESDMSIEDNIESQLWWSPYVDRDEISVSVDEGKATLTGTVDSWNEYYFAEQNAFEGGAITVNNDLIIDMPEEAN